MIQRHAHRLHDGNRLVMPYAAPGVSSDDLRRRLATVPAELRALYGEGIKAREIMSEWGYPIAVAYDLP